MPAFGFREHRSGKRQMFEPSIAHTVEQELERQGKAFLEGGAVYCDIFSGGAEESSFCPARTGWRNLEHVALWRQVAIVFMNLMSLVRTAGQGLVELIVAIVLFPGNYNGREFWQELFYIPRRLIVNIILREIVGISVEVDVTRGVPVIHANFWDTMRTLIAAAHSRLHTLHCAIDHTIRRIWNAARVGIAATIICGSWRITGEKHAIPYPHEYHREVGEAVVDMYRQPNGPTFHRRGGLSTTRN